MATHYTFSPSKQSAVPLYTDINGVYDFIGTGTLIHFRGQYLLISAAHCFDFSGQHRLLVRGNPPFFINRPVHVTQLSPGVSREADPFDFGAVSLRPNEVKNLSASMEFIPEDSIEGAITEDCSDDFGVFGFPARDNEVDNECLTLPANAIELPAKKNMKFRNLQTRRHPKWYLPLVFDPRNIEKTIGTDFVIPSPPCGMSGGPIIRYSSEGLRSLAGIVTEHHRKRLTLLGLRSSVIRELLNKWWSEIVETTGG